MSTTDFLFYLKNLPCMFGFQCFYNQVISFNKYYETHDFYLVFFLLLMESRRLGINKSSVTSFI